MGGDKLQKSGAVVLTHQLHATADLSAAKFFIPTLPGLPSSSTLTMYGGHLPSAPPKNGVKDTESDAHLYFFMLRSRHIADMERTVLWFNGGPGCSSFDGSLMEVGPLRLVPGGKGQLKEVEGAWNEYTNMIFSKLELTFGDLGGMLLTLDPLSQLINLSVQATPTWQLTTTFTNCQK